MKKRIYKFGGGTTVVLATCSAAIAGDLSQNFPVKAPVPYITKAPQAPNANGYDWNGWYIGVHVGVTTGSSNWSATQPFGAPNLGGSFDIPFNFDFMAGTGSYVAGVQGGYNHVFQSHLLLGWEADASFPNSDVLIPFSLRGSQTVSSPFTGQVTYGEAVMFYGSVRARAGYVFDHFLLYGTAGLAWTFDQVTRTQVAGFPAVGTATPGSVDTLQPWRVGWAAGAGVEIPITGSWTAKAEYLWTGFGLHSVGFAAGAQVYHSDLAMQSLRVGLNYRIGDTNQGLDFTTKGPSALETDHFAFHGQFTYLEQYDPPFRAPYSGPNSLIPNMARETADTTLYAGVRLWKGAEAWINPEIDQGFGLSGTLGVAGFTSGEAYKVGADFPYARLHRAFVRQTIDLGGETQKLEADINQFAGSQAANRLVLWVGRFSVVDVFDTNKYANSPKTDFLNWSMVNAGTFDYAGDGWGYSYGGAAEWYQGRFAVRGGVFDLSVTPAGGTSPDALNLDPTFNQFQVVGEIEERHQLWGQPGKIKVTGFLSHGRAALFSDANALAQATGTPADTALVRNNFTNRTGVSLNLEQQITETIGVFARAGWADGTIEPWDFTDIDRTFSGGVSINGKDWGRPDDTIGIGGVVNGIAGVHRNYFNLGGTGILIGDGQLPNPGVEGIVEAYYSYALTASTRVSVDYQFIGNPGYNTDRGPANVFAGRVHSQF